jgi:signal transduction histidine kinase
VSETSGIDVREEIGAIDGLLPMEKELHCFRIIQGSLSNIVKHSRAKNGEVRVLPARGTMTIEVSDNGIGIPHLSADRYGFGIRSIAERTKHCAGTFSIESSLGEGVHISVSIPYHSS